MKVSCVIPAYNEGRTVAAVIKAARQAAQVAEVIVVSDGSTDGTAEAAAAAGAEVVIRLPRNLGKGGAVIAGVRRAGEPVILLLDADLEHLNPAEIEALLQPVLRGTCQMAVGVLASDLVQRALPSLTGLRAVRKEVLLAHPKLAATGYAFERALTDLARRGRWKVARVPFTGVIHRRKEKKYGLIQGYRGKVRMAVEVAGLRRQRNGTPRRRGGLVVLSGLALVLVSLNMGLFASNRAMGSALEVLPDPESGERYLIVVAHADDEVAAAGGLIQRAVGSGAEVWVVFGTNGDANRLAAAKVGRRLLPRPADFIAEGEARQREAQLVLAHLGVPQDRIIFLGYPDQGLMAMAVDRREAGRPFTSPYTRVSASPYRLAFRPGASYTGADLLQDLETVLTAVRPDVVLTHHEADRHRDHRALNLMMRQAIQSLEQRGVLVRPRMYAFLVHAWDYPRPLRYAPGDPLLPPKSLRERGRWLRFDLTTDELAVKEEAMRAYRSQLDSPYLRLLLMSFLRQNELFAVVEP